jgi:hypothetical protein
METTCRIALWQVFCIREAATQNLQKLAAEFGPEWAKEHIVPQVRWPSRLAGILCMS